jgi:hypothetical protein
MSRLQILLLVAVAALVLLGGAVVGAYYYLFGAPEVASEELVPGNTIAFASIPNGAVLAEAYETSQAKTLTSSANFKPLRDLLGSAIGQKNVDLLRVFLPNLSGQSFIALTSYDPDHPQKFGLIAAMKPKAGMGDFGSFLDKLKATYPELLKTGTTGHDTVEGYDYDWIQGPGAEKKICVARIRGWIVTSWGEETLADWIERFNKRSTTSSLADDVNYRQTVARVGDNPMSLVFVNYHGLLPIVRERIGRNNPALSDHLAKQLDDLGGAAVGTSFEGGEIVDRYSFLMPRPAQLEAGMGTTPCAFDTLKFTGHDTRFYWAASVNWKQNYENLRAQAHAGAGDAETAKAAGTLQDWLHSENLDLQHNIIEALGSEVSIQSEWGDQTNFPEIGLFVKLDHPDDFKPVVAALIESVRKACTTTGVIQQISLPNQNFATLNFVPSGQITPTITEDGPYLGVFLTSNQAVRSYQRDPTINLLHNPNFIRQIGDRRNGAHQIVFLDSPYILDRGFKLAAPYLALASLFNKDLAAVLQDHPLPDDAKWLAPIGTWSCVVSTDETGVQAYSVSGVGNQGVLWSGLAVNGVQFAQHMGALPTLDTLLHSLEPPAPPVATSLGELPPATPAATTAPAPPALGSPLPTPALPSTNAPDATFPPPPTPPSP